MVVESQSKELLTAKKLMREGKYEEALEIIKNFENKAGISDEEKLSALILEGRLYTYIGKFQEAVRVGDDAYYLSQKLGSVSAIIRALLLKSNTVQLGNLDEALNITLEAENLMDSLEKETSLEFPRERAVNLYAKAQVYFLKEDYDRALESALINLSFRERIGKEMGIANTYILIGYIYFGKGDLDPALVYATKSLKLQKEMSNSAGIATSLTLIGNIHFSKGDFDQALLFVNQALKIKELSNIDKFLTISLIGRIYGLKGELDRALRYYEQALKLSEEIDHKHPNVGLNWVNIGNIYRMKGDYDEAIKFLKRVIQSTDQIYRDLYLRMALFWLVFINLDKDVSEEARRYLTQLEEISHKTDSKLLIMTFQIAKALVLKASGLTRNRYEAESLLLQISEGDIIDPEMFILALVSLCEYLLEELENSNDLEIINEINPIISRLLEISENNHSYSTLAETNLLQGRLALITLNLNDARQFLTSAQKIAEEHGLTLLAQKISQEHDSLLEELETWQSLKKNKVSMAKRMKMASVDGVFERMLGKRVVDPSEVIEEEPILLLIMDNAGNTFFNHKFAKNWDYEDLFSSFMSAFNTFSSEIFSKSIDRIKIDENLILINPIEPFLICYVIKGQSYSALKKLNSFAEAIRNKSEIWDSLQKSIKTSEMLDLSNPPSLGTAVNEIFSH